MPPALIIDFKPLRTVADLGLLLGADNSLLSDALSFDPEADSFSPLYQKHRIPKRRPGSGGVRVVWEVLSDTLRDVHRAYARRFEMFARSADGRYPHDASFGYIRGRGTRAHAATHCGSRWLFRADIASFFDSISRDMLSRRFLSLGLTSQGADLLSAFSTINGRLALGLNASPLLANLVCTDLDIQLSDLALRHGCRYSRYADDLYFSGESVPSFCDVAAMVALHGFELPKRKHRITRNGQAHFVTGLSVSDPATPHAPRRLKRQLRQELYYCRKFGIASHLTRIGEERMQRGINRIDGTIRYLGAAEPARYHEFRDTWLAAVNDDNFAVSYAPRANAPSRRLTYLVDESEILLRDNSRLLAIACVTTPSIEFLSGVADELQRRHRLDPFAGTRKDKLDSKGLHFTDVHEELRTEYVSLLAFAPFRGYIAYGALGQNDDYEAKYLALLQALLPRRFMASDRESVHLLAEQNSRIRLSALQELVRASYERLEVHDNRRPYALPTVAFGTKSSTTALTVPDFMLGVFNRYFGDARPATLTDVNRFERLRDKFRHIVNIDNQQVFSRRHPLE